MGRKTHPNILRVGNITHDWDGKWFADGKTDFRDKLQEDLAIRRYLDKALRMASISRLEISRQQKEIVLTVHSSRPAVIIGRGGSGIEKIQKDLQKKLGKDKRFRINVIEVRNPDTDATAVATQIVEQLERRMPYRRIIKQSTQRAMQAGAKGVRVAMAGRLNGADIARTEWLSDGNVPLHTFRADISYSSRTAHTTYGTIGVKVWINRGAITDTVEEADKKDDGKSRRPRNNKRTPRRRKSLASKVTKNVPTTKKSK